MSDESHSYRIRGIRWKKIKEKAWEISTEEGEMIQPTDIVDAIIWLGTKEITLEDVKNAKISRKAK